MNEDNVEIEAVLRQVQPQPAADLQAQVALSVDRGLRQAARKRGFRSVVLSFGILVVTVVVCAALSIQSNANLASLFGPKKPPRHIALLAEDIEKITNKQTADWFIQRAMGRR